MVSQKQANEKVFSVEMIDEVARFSLSMTCRRHYLIETSRFKLESNADTKIW